MRRCRKLQQESNKPLVSRRRPVPMHFGEVQRQPVVDQRVLDLRARPRNLVVGLGQLLQIVASSKHRIDITLERAATEHLQNYCGILGIVLVPGVEHRLAIARLRNGIDAHHLEPFDQQPVGNRTMIVAGRLERHSARTLETVQELEQAIDIGGGIGHPESVLPAGRRFDQNRIPVASDVDRHQVVRRGSICHVSHLGFLLRSMDKPKDAVTPDGWHSACTTAPSSIAIPQSSTPSVCSSISPRPITPGNVAPTKTPTASSASTCPSAPAWPRSLSTTAMSSPTNSIPDHVSVSTSKPQRSASMRDVQCCSSKLTLGLTAVPLELDFEHARGFAYESVGWSYAGIHERWFTGPIKEVTVSCFDVAAKNRCHGLIGKANRLRGGS